MKRIAFVLLLVAVVTAPAAVAQSSGGLKSRTFDLTIVVDAYGAEIWVDGVRIAGTVARVTPGVHAVRVRVEGAYDYTENVNVTSDRTLVVRMKPRTYPVTIRANVPAVRVAVDGETVAGTVASVSAGPHTLVVSADGYQDAVMSINVAAPMVVDVTLERSGFLLTVNANVRAARVIIDGVSRGTVPFSEYLPPGTYTVRVTARGYADYVASIVLDGPVTVNASLQQGLQPGGTSMLSVAVPAEYLDPDLRGRDLGESIRIYLDGRLVNQKRELEKIPVPPGRHTLRIATGALSIDLGEVEFAAGTSYTFELAMDVGIRAERRARSY